MKIGLWAPRGGRMDMNGRGSKEEPTGLASFNYSVDVIQTAERAGFDITLVAQRYIGQDLDGWILASALAPVTKTIELMVAIHPGILTPGVVAKMGASLDQISNGRFAINLVNGWWQEEMNTYGNGAWIDRSDARYRRMEEFIDVVKGLWKEDKLDYDGEFFKVAGGVLPAKPVRQPNPPFYAASRSETGMNIIASKGECWFAVVEPWYREFEANFGVIRDGIAGMRERASRYGRTLGYGISAAVICSPDGSEAEAIADDLEQRSKDRSQGGTSISALGAGLVGSPQRIADRIRRYEDAGVTCLMLRFPHMMDGVTNFAEHVMPLLDRKR